MSGTIARLKLLRWLGPWASDAACPRVEVVERETPNGTLVRRFVPRSRERARVLIAPGLHYDGPFEARQARFCSILASAGFRVDCPHLSDFKSLEVTTRTTPDFIEVFDDAPADIVFSISFGSLPALALAKCRSLSRLIIFGGYRDFSDIVRFSLSPPPGRAHDPLNRPVVIKNLLPWVRSFEQAERADVCAAWMRYVRSTWGKREMKADAWRAVAEREQRSLSGESRTLYRIGTGLDDGALELAEAAITEAGDELKFLSPPTTGLRARERVVFHGADDDVIPFEEGQSLANDIDAELFITGLYGHSESEGRSSLGELRTMVGMLNALARGVSR